MGYMVPGELSEVTEILQGKVSMEPVLLVKDLMPDLESSSRTEYILKQRRTRQPGSNLAADDIENLRRLQMEALAQAAE